MSGEVPPFDPAEIGPTMQDAPETPRGIPTRERLLADIYRASKQIYASREERSRGPLQQVFGAGSMMAGADYGLAMGQRAVGAATGWATNLAGGAIRLASFGHFAPDLSYGNLLDKVSQAYGGDGRETERALGYIEKDRAWLTQSRLLGEEVLGFAAPFGVLGSGGAGKIMAGIAAGVKLPGTVIQRVAAPIAERLGAGTRDMVVRMAERVGMTTTQIGAANQAGTLFREVISRSPLPMKVARWMGHSLPQIAGTAVGLGSVTAVSEYGDRSRNASLAEAAWSGLAAGVMAPLLVAGGQVANRVQTALTRGGLAGDNAAALHRYMTTGKGWSPALARVAGGFVEGLFMDPRTAVDFVRAVNVGDFESMATLARSFLASAIGGAALRGIQADDLPVWRRKFPEDIVDPLQVIPPTLSDVEQVRDLQRHGWKATTEGDTVTLKIPGFDGAVRLDTSGELAVEFDGDAWKNQSAALGLERVVDPGLGMKDKDGRPLHEAKREIVTELRGDDAQEALDRLAILTAKDNMRLRQARIEDAIEVEPGLWAHPTRGVAMTHRFGSTMLRAGVEGPWRAGKIDLGDPVRRTNEADLAALDKARDFIAKLKMPTDAAARLSDSLNFLEYSRPDDAGANEALAFLGAFADSVEMRALADRFPRQFSRLFHRVASGTMDALDAADVMSAQVAPPPGAPVGDASGVGYAGLGRVPQRVSREEATAQRGREAIASLGGTPGAPDSLSGGDVGYAWLGDVEAKPPKKIAEMEDANRTVSSLGDPTGMAPRDPIKAAAPAAEAPAAPAAEPIPPTAAEVAAPPSKKPRVKKAAPAAPKMTPGQARRAGRMAGVERNARAGNPVAIAEAIGGLHPELISRQFGSSTKEWLGRNPPPGMFSTKGVRSLDRLAEKLAERGLADQYDPAVPADKARGEEQAAAFLESLRSGQRVMPVGADVRGELAGMADDAAAAEADMARAAAEQDAEAAADDAAEREAVAMEAVETLQADPDFNPDELDALGPDVRIDQVADDLTSGPDTNPESGRALNPWVAVGSAVEAVFKPASRVVQGLREYFSRPVAERARAELHEFWGERDVHTLRDHANVVELKELFERSLGRNPITGDRPTTDAGRRVARLLNRGDMARTLEDLLFYAEKTGNPRYDDGGKLDTLADVERRLPPEAREIAEKMRAMWDDLYRRSVDTPLIHTPAYLENYVRHSWASGPDGRPVTNVNNLLKRESRLQNPVFARERTIPTFADGMRMGYRPTTLNPFDILLSSATAVNRITTAARFVDELSRIPIAENASEMMVMPADKAPDYYVEYPSPLLAGMAVHPELVGGTSRGYSDQSRWDRLLKFSGGLDILDRVTGAADFDWGGRGSMILGPAKLVAQTIKKIKISASLFHHFVLGVENRLLFMTPTAAEVGMALMGKPKPMIDALRKGFGGPSAIMQMLKGDVTATLDRMRSPEAAIYVQHGLNLTGMPSDFQGSATKKITEALRRGGKWFGGEQIASVLESIELFQDKILWDVMVPNLKITLADMMVDREMRRQGRELKSEEMEIIMAHVNGTVGNTDWNRVWRVPKSFSDLMSGTVFFAWDWTASNMRAGPMQLMQGIAEIRSKGYNANQHLRYGGYTTISAFVKAALVSQVVQAGIWAVFGDDEERERLSLAGKSPNAPTWENEGSGSIFKYQELLSIRLPKRGANGEVMYLRPWKQIGEQFAWLTDFRHTLFNKLSVPLQESLKAVMGVESPGWPTSANDDAEVLDGMNGTLQAFGKQLVEWMTPFSVANTTTPAGGWGILAPFPISAGTTNYKTREHLSLAWQNYARSGNPAVLEDIRWIVAGANANSLPTDTLFKQSISLARAPLYRTYFQALDGGDLDRAGRALLALTRLGASSRDVTESIKARFKAAIGRREQPETDLREAFNRARATYDSILEDVPEAKKSMLRVRRDVMESWRRNADFVKIPARPRAGG